MNSAGSFIDPHGGFRNLKSYQMSESVFTLICLVHQTNFLLDRQLRQLGQRFLNEGGFTERSYRSRLKARSRS